MGDFIVYLYTTGTLTLAYLLHNVHLGRSKSFVCKKKTFVCVSLHSVNREFASENNECMPCHAECAVQENKHTCRGPVISPSLKERHSGTFMYCWILNIRSVSSLLQGTDQCEACENLQDGPYCVSSCPEGVQGENGLIIYKFPNSQQKCQPCHANCSLG